MVRWWPETASERAQVREQLARLTSNAAFRNSRRNTALLEYLVERTLSGAADSLKERSIGVEVFGRTPGYDTAADHVVRSTAAEVRRRLAQYYHDESHSSELRIELAPGSYVPYFALPIRSGEAGAASETELDRFWAPLTRAHAPVLLCIGGTRITPLLSSSPGASPEEPAKDQLTLGEVFALESQKVAFSDAAALAAIAGYLGRRSVPFRITHEHEARLEDIRQAPAVLLGAFNNDWGIRLAGELRYTFHIDHDGRACSVLDRAGENSAHWTVYLDRPFRELERDYGLLSRVADPATGETLLLAGGITMLGTLAAGQLLTRPALFEPAASLLAGAGERRNVQIVFSTEVLRGSAASPRILEVWSW